MKLWDIIERRKIFFITGKGGTGKSTYTVSLGRFSAKKNKTLIVDFDNKRSTIREILKCQGLSTEPKMIEDNLYFSHIEPEDALRYYLNDFLKSDFLINLAVNLRPLKLFYQALPSAKEMLITYFLLHLVRDFNFERIFIDMPASGHAELFLKIPYSAKGIFNRGPVINIVNEMNKLIYNNSTSTVIQVSLPEEVVISETIEYYHKFNSIENISVACVILNKVYNMEDVDADSSDIFQYEDVRNLYGYYIQKYREQRFLIKHLRDNTNAIIFEVPFFVGKNPSESIFEHFLRA